MKTNKTLALVLAVLMLFSVAPVTVLAVDLPTVPSVELSDGDGVITLKRGYVGFPEDKNVGQYEILYSTDQTNWKVADYMSRDRDSRLISIRKPWKVASLPARHITLPYVRLHMKPWVARKVQ